MRKGKRDTYSGAYLEGRGGKVSPTLFKSLKESVLISEKNTLTIFTYGFNFSFKTLF